ncbi:uncharacterized protein LOC136081514 [Hydra vulgaris]|uniref:Uncharacterized protein LOC136081514 n=1 Tax=Hydra vulgaris TaxID=6087 RepID=A0ABM4C064_HYDVU
MGLRSITIETMWQVVGLNKSGLSNQEIGRQLEISECSVRTTLKNYNEFGTVEDKSRSGRPKKMSERDENKAIMLARRNPNINIAEIASDLNTALGAHQVSRSTISKLLKKKLLKSYLATKKPLLSIKDRHKQRKWCKERAAWTVEQWRKVIFSDKSKFELFNRKKRVVVRRYKTKNIILVFLCQEFKEEEVQLAFGAALLDLAMDWRIFTLIIYIDIERY